MATRMGPRGAANLGEVVLARMSEPYALLKLLARKGVVTKAEFLAQVEALCAGAAKA